MNFLPEAPNAPALLDAAVRDGDYALYRHATLGFDGPLRRQVIRWLAQHPDADARLGTHFRVADVIESVFLRAFDGYRSRPAGVAFGDWLAELIAPAARELMGRSAGDAEAPGLAFAF